MSAIAGQSPSASQRAAGVRMPSRLDDQPAQKVPFSRLVRAEFRKGVDTRAGRWLLIVIGAITLLAVVALLFAGSTDEDHAFETFVSIGVVPQTFLLPIVGILVVTAEWSQRTGLTTFSLEPNRTKVGMAKLVASTLLGLILVAVVFAGSALATALAGPLKGTDPSWAMDWQVVVGNVGGLLISLAIGVAFAMILQNTPAAIVAYLMLPTLWSILGSTVSWLKDASAWLDTQSTLAPLYEGAMVGDDWAKLGVSVLVWVVLPLIAGLVRLNRSEIK